MTLLAVNNHDLEISIERMVSNANTPRPDLWSDMYSIKFNLKKKSDLLPYAMKGLDVPFTFKDGFMLNTEPLNVAYKKLTGEDLESYGLNAIVIQGLSK